ncbi:hypothetical protein CVS40_7776 [Lucilia cuprina]|nr:hypothetical protein CVS40_7776 [Lucilia cuprina]
MGKLLRSLLYHSNNMENSSPPTTSTTLDSSLFNFMENFEEDSTDVPSVCRLHIPTWLNLWCVFISICVLMLLVVLGVLVRYIQLQKQRIIRSEIVHVSPDFYREHFLDRSQIMVY